MLIVILILCGVVLTAYAAHLFADKQPKPSIEERDGLWVLGPEPPSTCELIGHDIQDDGECFWCADLEWVPAVKRPSGSVDVLGDASPSCAYKVIDFRSEDTSVHSWKRGLALIEHIRIPAGGIHVVRMPSGSTYEITNPGQITGRGPRLKGDLVNVYKDDGDGWQWGYLVPAVS